LNLAIQVQFIFWKGSIFMDTYDIAEKLFLFLTGYTYSKHLDHYVDPEQMLEDIEKLVTRCKIEYDDVRWLLRQEGVHAIVESNIEEV